MLEREALLTEADVAEMMGVTTHAVRKWRTRGLITFIRVGQTVRFEPAEVEAFIERHRCNAEARCA